MGAVGLEEVVNNVATVGGAKRAYKDILANEEDDGEASNQYAGNFGTTTGITVGSYCPS
jgi:hypothetical protein